MIDSRNWEQWKAYILSETARALFIGLDIETHDHDRHEGLNQFMKIDDEGFRHNKKLVFDVNRTIITGFSIYCDGSPYVYYFNCGHADVENCLDGARVLQELIDARNSGQGWFIAHNAPFELTFIKKCFGIELDKILCTLQLSVTSYGPDEYEISEFNTMDINGLSPLFPEVTRLFGSVEEEIEYIDVSGVEDNGSVTVTEERVHDQKQRLISKVVGKDSKAAHSYNGWVRDNLAYGYGLKKAVKRHFDYDMVTFEQVLGDRPHMGCLTGAEVVSYGCDDAYWAVRLYHKLYNDLSQKNPGLTHTFFAQENPMIHVYSDVNKVGMRINREAIDEAHLEERRNYANILRELRGHVRAFLIDGQWPEGAYNERSIASLQKREEWYVKNGGKYRASLVSWATEDDLSDDYRECYRTRGSLPDAWATERGEKQSKTGLNFSHYMPMRVLMFDLCGLVPIVGNNGKIQSDADARSNLVERVKRAPGEFRNPENILGILGCIARLAGVEQRIKLYIKPYSLLADPDTGRVYPVYSSQLATRRMATQNPNPMQLSKSGVGAYIRSFYLADNDEHLILSMDWSAIELVLIAELSRDPAFLDCYSTLPYRDLHSRAAASMLTLDLELFKDSKSFTPDQFVSFMGKEPLNFKGEKLLPEEWYKEMRRDVGKGANFEYWYSGSLSNLADQLGWDRDTMYEKTDLYRKEFPVAEAWRQAVQAQMATYGFVQLPDGHRRYRYEATDAWMQHWITKWIHVQGGKKFAQATGKALKRRSLNQGVNVLIQGSNAAMAKRSILRINKELKAAGFDARFMVSVHDELLFSVNHKQVLPFLHMAKPIMCHHPDLFQICKLDATAAIGFNYQAFNEERNPLGQFELDEASKCSFLPPEFHGKKLNDEQILQTVEFIRYQMQRETNQ